MASVAVLMSTYNGEKYLREQIDSILRQRGVDITLFIRDDGSNDKTISIINEYQAKASNIVSFICENVGVGRSFMQLVYNAGTDYDYYAFADQDDIWLENKIISAINKITSRNDSLPVLYCSNQTLIDADGKTIGDRHKDLLNTSYKQILCNNQISGCTMVWNKKLQSLLVEPKRRPTQEMLEKRIHDVWVSMVASVCGRIIYDPESHILYRQHDNNVVGVKRENMFELWGKKVKNERLRNGRSGLASEIERLYGSMIRDTEVNDFLKCCSEYKHSFKNKLLLLKNREIPQLTNENPFLFYMKVVTGVF